jgi:hypothetical protein
MLMFAALQVSILSFVHSNLVDTWYCVLSAGLQNIFIFIHNASKWSALVSALCTLSAV